MSDRKRKMPKIDLHCHLDGSLSRACIGEILGRTVEPAELQAGMECKSLAEYLEKFDLPLTCLKTGAGLKRAGKDFMQNVAAEGMDYVEVRFAPLLSAGEHLNCEQVIESVLEGLEEGRRLHGIDYGVIVCAMRHHGEEENLRMLKTARGYLGAGVCGADLAGDEAAWPMKSFLPLFSKVKAWNMPFTIHAGECGSVENVAEAVECGASRIGHGIALRGHPEIMGICREKRVGLEMCPISNLQTKAVHSKAEYPMREFLQNGLLVTVNTDNRTVSATTIDREIRFVQENYGITDSEVSLMMRNAVEVSFAPDDIRQKLLKKFES